ncbi:MAG: hypothetical protein RR088_01695, partial [Clostridia bacterium]
MRDKSFIYKKTSLLFAKIKLVFSMGKNNIFSFKSLVALSLVVTCLVNSVAFGISSNSKVLAAAVTPPVLPNIVETSSNQNLINGSEQIDDYNWYTSGVGTESSPYLIKHGDELAALSRIVNGTVNSTFGIAKSDFNGKFIKLMSRGVAVNDNVIDLINYGGAFYWNDTEEVFSPKISQIGENKGWMPIGNAAVNSFKGSFDGNNIEVSNLSAWCTADDNARANFGLFGNVDFSASGSIKNLVLNRVQAKSTNVAANIGAVVGTGIFNVNNIAISNCSVKNTIPIANSSDFFLKTVMEDKDHATLGGIIGSAENIKIQNCKADGTIELENKMVNVKSPAETGNKNATEQGKGLGGIVGSLNVNSTLQDNDTNIVYNVKNNKTEFGYIGINTFFGGIVGITNNIGINILNNISSVKLTANYSADGVGVGGIVGGSGIVLLDAATKINLTNN